MWVLTELAIKNGVQSTTRYRKTGGAKKTNLNRVPAVQRQRSGAKGGQAARRAAKLRRREQAEYQQLVSPLQALSTPSSFECSDPYACTAETDYLSNYAPVTPPDDRLFGVSNALPLAPNSIEPQRFKMDGGHVDENEQSMHDLGAHGLSDACIDDLLRLHPDSSSAVLLHED